MLHVRHEDRRAPSITAARAREVAILALERVIDQADAVRGVKPRVKRSKAGWHRGRRHVEPKEAHRHVEQTPAARDVPMHCAATFRAAVRSPRCACVTAMPWRRARRSFAEAPASLLHLLEQVPELPLHLGHALARDGGLPFRLGHSQGEAWSASRTRAVRSVGPTLPSANAPGGVAKIRNVKVPAGIPA